MQVIFQDPMAALNPYMKIGEAIRHGLQIHHIGASKKEQKEMVMEMLRRVNLTPENDFYNRYPRELSGVSVRSQLLKLLIDLKQEMDLTYLFITHDLATTKYICHRIAVMYLGKIVEIGSFENIYNNPLHPYTKALIAAVPELHK